MLLCCCVVVFVRVYCVVSVDVFVLVVLRVRFVLVRVGLCCLGMCL